jgi:rhodanese-related sulfurtransferase
MKNLFVKSILVAVTSLGSTLAADPAGSQPANPLQDTQKAVEYFDAELNFKTNAHFIKRAVKEQRKDVVIVDVRAAKDFDKGHIPGAINVPFDKFGTFEGPETAFEGLRKDAFNCVYCYTPTCNLAQKAARKFASLGYPVKEIQGGFEGWTQHQHPVEASTQK